MPADLLWVTPTQFLVFVGLFVCMCGCVFVCECACVCMWCVFAVTHVEIAYTGAPNALVSMFSVLFGVCCKKACFLVLLCVMHAVGCVFVKCMCLGVCLCVSGCEPSILLIPSGLCVGLFEPALPPVSVLLGPQGYNDCRTFQICSSGPSDRLPYLKSGSHFLSEDQSKLDSPVQFSWVNMMCSWTASSWAEFD